MNNREAAKKLRVKSRVEDIELKPLSEFRTKAELVAYAAKFGLELSDELKMSEMYASIAEHLKKV